MSENTASRRRELFGEFGEDVLRDPEYEALVECANMGHSLISCGEGIVAFDKSRELLKRRGFAVMLESSEATLGRIHNLSTRPLLRTIATLRAFGSSAASLRGGCARED